MLLASHDSISYGRQQPGRTTSQRLSQGGVASKESRESKGFEPNFGKKRKNHVSNF